MSDSHPENDGRPGALSGSCTAAAPWLHMWSEGELDAIRSAEVAAHVATCESCADEVDALRDETAAMLARLVPDAPTLPANFAARIGREIREDREFEELVRDLSETRVQLRTSRRWLGAVSAALVATALVAVAIAQRPWQPTASSPRVAALVRAAESAKAPASPETRVIAAATSDDAAPAAVPAEARSTREDRSVLTGERAPLVALRGVTPTRAAPAYEVALCASWEDEPEEDVADPVLPASQRACRTCVLDGGALATSEGEPPVGALPAGGARGGAVAASGSLPAVHVSEAVYAVHSAFEDRLDDARGISYRHHVSVARRPAVSAADGDEPCLDANSDGRTDALDAVLLLRLSLGSAEEFLPGGPGAGAAIAAGDLDRSAVLSPALGEDDPCVASRC